jgi:ubiquinone/menaquinone biosynthesis C-methylase UbiE
MSSSDAKSSKYLMESHSESERLEAKTDAEVTRQHLTMTGLGHGMRCLDAGAGTGAVARVMAELVGANGEAVAVDGSRERMDYGRERAQQDSLKNIRFVTSDLYALPDDIGQFDYAWSRFVFEYLAEPDRVLAQLCRVVKPGGKVVVGDLDGNAIFHYPMSDELTRGLDSLMVALAGQFDPYAGRKLFSRFKRANLCDIRVHMLPYHLYAGTASPRDMDNWVAKFRTIRPVGVRALGSEDAYDRWAQSFLGFLEDDNTFTYSVLFLVEGTRP